MTRAANPQGELTWQGNELCLRFRYNKQRFAAIKKIPGARYLKETKGWHLPLLSYGYLAENPLFSPEVIRYNIDKEKFEEQLTRSVRLREEAVSRVLANPFSVAPSDIELIAPDVVVRLSKDQSSLRVDLASGKRKAKKILEEVSGAHYIKADRAYFLPVIALRSFLLRLRDARVSFVVESATSQRLQESQEVRSALTQKEEIIYPARELAHALCTPFLTAGESVNGDYTFSLCGFTTEQLRLCIPQGGSYASKKSAVSGVSASKALSLLYQAKNSGIEVFVSEEAHYALAPRIQEIGESADTYYPDVLLAVDVPKACWSVDPEGRAGLLLRRDLLQELISRHTTLLDKIPLAKTGLSTNHYFIRPLESKLFELYQEISLLTGLEFELLETKQFHETTLELRRRRELRERSRYFTSLGDASPEVRDHELQAKLFPHQRVAVSWLLENKSGFLGDDMGLGKTLSILATAKELASRKAISSILVVCPHSLVRNWMRECERWTPELRFVSLPTTKKERDKALRNFCDSTETQISMSDSICEGLVINYETLRIDGVYQELAKYCKEQTVLLCVDESQRIKNPKSKSFLALQHVAEYCPRRVLLSGTPTPRDVSDIWGQMLILDQGERFGTNFYEWLSTVAELGNKFSDYAVKRFIPERVDEVVSRVQEVLLRRRKEDVLNLPEKLFSVRDLELTGAQKKRYDEVREELLLRVRSTSGKEFVRKIESVLEEYLRAVQVASNPRLIDPDWKGEPAKFLELDAIVKEVVEEKGEKIVIWTNYLGNVRELCTRYQKYGVAPFSGELNADEKNRTIERFQDKESDELRILVAVPAAGGVGITLTAAQTAVYVEKTWNAEHWLQSVDRIHRIGQTGSVNVISLSAGKVDDLIFWNLKRKERFQKRLLDEPVQQDELFPTKEQLIEALS